jgi:hypothetical protein
MSESCRFGMQINNNHLEKYGLLLMKYILPPNEIHTPDIFKKTNEIHCTVLWRCWEETSGDSERSAIGHYRKQENIRRSKTDEYMFISDEHKR